MMSPLKIGLSVACLVGVALFIVVDMSRGRTEDASPAASGSSPAAPTVLPGPVASPASAGSTPPVPRLDDSNIVIACPKAVNQAGIPLEKKAPMAKTGALEPSKAGTAEKGEGAPVASPSEKMAALENVPARITGYTVVQGDTLYGISVKVFGTPRYYERIFEENRDRIADPNTLQIGLNLKMPNVPAKAAVGVADVKAKEPGPIPAAAPPPAVETGSKDLR